MSSGVRPSRYCSSSGLSSWVQVSCPQQVLSFQASGCQDRTFSLSQVLPKDVIPPPYPASPPATGLFVPGLLSTVLSLYLCDPPSRGRMWMHRD
jgi:hypothetical protein